MSNSPALQGVTEQNEKDKKDYEGGRNRVGVQVIIILVQACTIAFLGYLVFVHFPQKELMWTNNAGAVCKATRQDVAQIHHATLTQFAQEAAVRLNSYDYLNYRRQLTDVTERYMTPRGRDHYFKSLDDVGLIETVKKNFFIVTSFVNNPPQLARKGNKGETPFWLVEVPVTIWYAAGQQRIKEDRVLTMTLVPVEPSPLNSLGIAVDLVTSTQPKEPTGSLR